MRGVFPENLRVLSSKGEVVIEGRAIEVAAFGRRFSAAVFVLNCFGIPNFLPPLMPLSVFKSLLRNDLRSFVAGGRRWALKLARVDEFVETLEFPCLH